MMIAPATELAHMDDEIAELVERREWLRWCKRLCVGGPVSLEGREARVMSVAVGVAGGRHARDATVCPEVDTPPDVMRG